MNIFFVQQHLGTEKPLPAIPRVAGVYLSYEKAKERLWTEMRGRRANSSGPQTRWTEGSPFEDLEAKRLIYWVALHKYSHHPGQTWTTYYSVQRLEVEDFSTLKVLGQCAE